MSALQPYECPLCHSCYNSQLAADACEDEDRENRFDQ